MKVMAGHRDILDEPESLRNPVLGSVALHVLVFSSLVVYGMMPKPGRDLWGDPNSLGGGSVAVTPVSRIPLPTRGGPVNPVANDTESQVPAPPSKPKPEAKETPKEDAKAIALKSRADSKKKAAASSRRSSSRARQPERPSQIYSASGAAAASPMYGSTSGSGGVGLGTGSPFGGRFGWYEQILRERVASKWRTDEVDPRLQTAPPVIITFRILRDGSVGDLRILQRSGNPALDYSAQRAIVEASPFPALPPGFERDYASIEFWFQLRR